MLRFIIVCICVIGFLVLSIPLIFVEWMLEKVKPTWKDTSCRVIIQNAFRVILKVTGVKITVLGKERIPTDQPVLYIGNHRSFFDILLTYVFYPSITGFVAKAEMEKLPLLSTWMRYIHCLFLDRTDIKKGLKTILAGVEEMKHGVSLCIFPEGTRNRNESDLDLLEFHEGSFKLATRSNSLIVPIAMNNTSAIFEKQFPRIKKTHVVIEFCEPIDPNQLSKEDKKFLGKYTKNIIFETLKKNEELV